MKYLLCLIFFPLSVLGADFLDDFGDVRNQVKHKLGISTADTVLLPDTVLNQFIREGIAAQVDLDESHVLVDTFQSAYRQNEYTLDSLALNILSVRWQSLDSVKILRYMPESLWTEQKFQALPGQKDFDLRPSFYDYFRDTTGTIQIILYPIPVNTVADTFYVRFIAKPVNLATTSSLSSLSLKQRMIVLNSVTTMAAMHLRLLPPSEQVKRLSISGFGGLNTVTSDFQVKPNEARIAHNIDFSEEIGSLALRKGYDSVSAMNGMDSLVGIFGAYSSDGTQQLVLVADSDGVGYGNVYVSADGSSDVSSVTRIWQYFSVQNQPSFAMLDDNVYMVNGSHKGVVYNGDVARPYPLPAPGEPLIIPLNDSGPLHGEYIYRTSSDGGGWTGVDSGRAAHSDGIISSRVTVKNGKVLITGFQYIPTDSLDFPDRGMMRFEIVNFYQDSLYWIEIDGDTVYYTADADDNMDSVRNHLVDSLDTQMNGKVFTHKQGSGFIYSTPESSYVSYSNSVPPSTLMYATTKSIWLIYLHRTRANPGPIGPDDSAMLITTISVTYNDTTLLDTLTIIDSLPDTMAYATALYHDDFFGRDSLGNMTYRYGAPRCDSTSDSVWAGWGIFGDSLWPEQKDTLGVAYVFAFIDTNTSIQSDTSRALFVFCDSGNTSPSFQKVYLRLPSIPSYLDGVVLNLYRAIIYQWGHDTTAHPETPLEWKWAYRKPGESRHTKEYWWIDRFIPDTVVVGGYRLLSQIVSTDSIYVDSIPYDSVYSHRLYKREIPPPMMRMIFAFDTRLAGVQKSGLYTSWSVVDEITEAHQSWGAMNYTPVNPDDGDAITTVWPARGVLRAMKSFSNYNVYEDDAFQWNRVEISGYFGCLAGNSHVAGLGGHYYLSGEGVIREIEGMALERTTESKLVSAQLDNFDNYDIATLSEAQAFYFDNKYMLCVDDTMYVLDVKTQNWSTWDFTFLSATLYSTEDEVRFLPGDSMYFIKPGSSGLYRFGGSATDNGSVIPFVWQSVPWAITPEIKRVTTCDLWVDSDDSSSTLDVAIYDEDDQEVASVAYDDLTQFHTSKGIANNDILFGYLSLQPESGSSVANTVVHAVDLEYIILGKKVIE